MAWLSNSYFEVLSVELISCNLKPIAIRVLCLNMLFTYFWVSYDIVKLQTCSLLQIGEITTSRFSLLSKSVVTRKLWHSESFVKICYLPNYGSAITSKIVDLSLMA